MMFPVAHRAPIGFTVALTAAFVLFSHGSGRQALAQSGCSAPANAIVAENCLPGNLPSEWDIAGAGSANIQGFATDISVNPGDVVSFKVNVAPDGAAYHLDIYRMGYYGGAGARKVATVGSPTALTGIAQTSCLSQPATTGLVDCGNWIQDPAAVWPVPTTATSGIYFAKAIKNDGTGASHIVFIVRDDARQADVLFQTSDTTWQAYNSYGGNSLYCGGPGVNPASQSCAGRAYKVSYNRPFNTRAADATSWVFNAEYPMVRWLEFNGYDVKYWTGLDTDRLGADPVAGLTGTKKPKVFLSVGHDEYWAGSQRTKVEAGRDAGVHLAFFSGNEVFWKTRWEASIDGTNTPYRTLVTYKESHNGAKIDPSPEWTGSWRDARFSPPADGGRPENALTGSMWGVDCCSYAITVPSAMGALRFWRNTSLTSLPPGTSATLTNNSLGYEWNELFDNGFQPAGLVRLSSTTVDVPFRLLDNSATVGPGTATHSLTLYRKNGALVFGAGTVQWSWGLDGNHDRGGSTPDLRIGQATVNLLADMGVQSGSLQTQTGLVAAFASTDAVAPTSAITAPLAGANVESGARLTISGTGTDTGGGALAGVEVSVDGGATWHSSRGGSPWTYEWIPGAPGVVTIKSRATDDSGNVEVPSAGVTVNVIASSCPCTSLWNAGTNAPANPDTGDQSAVELGVKFSSDVGGFITGVRFYKSAANTGTHLGNLWTANGALLATAVFTNETASGWQQVTFASPVAITANATYVASYHTNVGHYAADLGYFASAGVNSPPLHAPASSTTPNGVFTYGTSSFPLTTFNAANYWVDVDFAEVISDSDGPVISQMRATAIDGSHALISWVTNEAADSRVDYSTNSFLPPAETLSATNAAFVTQHAVTLAGLTPNETYYYRLTSIDLSGNPTLALAPSFTLPGPTLHDTASVDFLAGIGGTTCDQNGQNCVATTYVSETGDGEVILAPQVGAEFSGSSLPAGWNGAVWQSGGTFAVGGGVLVVDGARVGTCATFDCVTGVYAPGHSLEFIGTFTGDPFQHSGFGRTMEAPPWAVFSTAAGGQLHARTFSETASMDTPLGTQLLGAPHRFRIEWTATDATYFVDGVLVASHSVGITTSMGPIAASDFNPLGGNVFIDWMRMTPHAASGSFVSRVFDAASQVTWNSVYWTEAKPAGTSVAISIRTGNAPVPDGTWSAFVPIAAPGAFTAQSRYVQYRAEMAGSGASQTPELSDIIISTDRAPVAVNDAASTPLNTTYTFSASGPNRLTVNDTDADTPLSQLRVIAVSPAAHGTATLNSNGSVSYIPLPGYIGADSFTYTITDGLLTSNAATVSMAVGNRPPVAGDDPGYVVNEDTILVVTAANRITANDNDPDGDPVTAFLVTAPAHGNVTLNTDGSFTYTPFPDTYGSDGFTYQVQDSSGALSNIASVFISVTAVNDAPSFVKGANQIVVKNAGLQTVSGWATAMSAGPSNEAGQSLNFLVGNSNNALFAVQPAVAVNGTLTFTPATNASGAATVTVQLHDNGGITNGGIDTSSPLTFTITVTDPLPVALCQNVTVTATLVGTAVASINAGSFDPDGGAVVLAQVPPGPYSPGQTAVILNVTDQASQTASCSATVTVNPFAIGLAFGFEEASGTTVLDSSGNQNHGAFNSANGPQRTAAGRFGKGMVFDGIDDLITVADSNSLDLTSAMTLMAWVKVTNQTGWRNILLKQNANSMTYAVYSNNAPSALGQPAGYVRAGGVERVAAATGGALQGQWTHIAVTYGGGSLRMYVDGNLERTVSATGNIAVTGGPLWLGGNLVWLDEFFSGVMDEVRILGVALPAADIRTLMTTPVVPGAAPPPTDPTGLVAAYNFNDGTATDRTGLGHHGVLQGPVSAPGIYGQALSFDGINDLVVIADANDLDFTTGMTIEAWVRPTTVTGWRTVALKEGPQGLVYSLYASDAAQHTGGFVRIAGAPGDSDARSPAPLPTNAWSHVVATYDKNLGVLKIWVDGVPRDDREITGNITVSAGSLFIGGNQFWGEYFNGLIDNVRIYNRALSIVEIQTNRNIPVF